MEKFIVDMVATNSVLGGLKKNGKSEELSNDFSYNNTCTLAYVIIEDVKVDTM